MSLNVGKELTALQRLTVRELRNRYAEVFREETRTGNRAWLIKRILWRLQSLAEGDLSERARKRAEELACEADVRMSPPPAKPFSVTPDVNQVTVLLTTRDPRLPIPGTLLVREYKGQKYRVQVLPNGFEFQDEVFRSLSAVAKKITGQHCNGFQFFQLGSERQA